MKHWSPLIERSRCLYALRFPFGFLYFRQLNIFIPLLSKASLSSRSFISLRSDPLCFPQTVLQVCQISSSRPRESKPSSNPTVPLKPVNHFILFLKSLQ